MPAAELPAFATELGYFARTLGGWRLIDPDIRATLDLLPPGDCERLVARAVSELKDSLQPLQELPFLPDAAAYVSRDTAQLTHPSTLAEQLRECEREFVAIAGLVAGKMQPPHERHRRAVQRRLDKQPQAMTIRRRTVEHVFGTLKHWMGSTHFLTRTLANVSTEMSLHVLAYNLKRVMSILGIRKTVKAISLAGA